MIKAVFLDFDWTLFSHKTQCVPASAFDAICALKQKGIKVFLATGRNLEELQLFEQYTKFGFDGYILANGQAIYDSNTNFIYGIPFKKEVLQPLVDMYISNERPIVFCDEKKTYMNYVNQMVIDAHTDFSYIEHKIMPYKGEDVYLAVLFITPQEELELKPKLAGCDFKRWGNHGVDVVPEGVDKATGIAKVIEMYGFNKDEIMVVGDSFNDIGMMKYAGCSVAMGNAQDVTKEAATYVTDDIDRDGLANAFKHFGLI